MIASSAERSTMMATIETWKAFAEMYQYNRLLWIIMILIVGTACSALAEDVGDGPRLVQESTLVPTQTPLISEGPITQSPTPPSPQPEVVSPLDVVTLDAQYILVTPTLPPSKTPTQTPTQTPSPTFTVTASATAFLLPTSEIIEVTDVVAAPANRICDTNWWFIQPRPDSCPMQPPSASNGVYQRFQNGHMVWVGSQDAIYVMYDDSVSPRWEVKRDFFDEGEPEESPQYNSAPQSNLWQPRRGFGLLWRTNDAIRQRIGWATQQWEEPFSVQVQTSDDGTIFVSQPGSNIFALLPEGEAWQEYSASGGSVPIIENTPPPALGGN